MAAVTELKPAQQSATDLVSIVRELGGKFAARAAEFDETDEFVGENYHALKEAGLVDAGVPKEFGGGGHDVAELAAMLRELAHHCGSTALAFAMHTHQVAIPAWRWVHQ
jgi:alkylation response protein AidB-like acyl-CoA dehydrogenase